MLLLNGDITEDIYMQQPQGLATNPSLVCRLKKSLYGLKQAPRAWYAKIDSFLLSLNFVRCKLDPNVYLKLIHGSLLLLFCMFMTFSLQEAQRMKLPP